MPVTAAGRRTREALLDAGAAVAERSGLSGLSVNAIVDAAGVAKGTFYVHFPDRDAFVDALHERFYVNVASAVADAVGDRPHGAARLIAGANAYLDACLRQQGVKLVLREMNGGACGADAVESAIQARERSMARLVEPNVRALASRDVPIVARFVVAMIAETAMIELAAGARVPAARRALRRTIESLARHD